MPTINELLEERGTRYGIFAHQANIAQELKEIIKAAIQHKGFAHIDVEQDCPSFRRWAMKES